MYVFVELPPTLNPLGNLERLAKAILALTVFQVFPDLRDQVLLFCGTYSEFS